MTTPTRAKRRAFAFAPGRDTVIAAITLLLITVSYYFGTKPGTGWVLNAGIIIAGTLIPAWTIFVLLKGGWDDLGITRHRLTLSLIIAALLGAGSAYQVIQLATEQQVAVAPHLLGNMFVLWEPLFVFGWLFLRWERAFGYVPAVLLTGVGFTIQHLGSVPVEQAVGFGMFALFFAVVFAITRNLFILWPLFYGVASAIGTLQAGFVFDWAAAIEAIVLAAVQAVLLVGVAWWARRNRADEVSSPA